MKTFGLIVNGEKARAGRAAALVLSHAEALGMSALSDSPLAVAAGAAECPAEAFAARGAGAAVVLGGDGTMLDAARRLGGQDLPLMGLNIGSLGYLTCVEEAMFGDALRRLRDGAFTLSRRTALSARIRRPGGACRTLPDALNDVVVSRGARGSAVELDLSIDGREVSRFLCDGLIVATPTGSTAYSLSAGGPILLPDAEALAVCLICPHTLTSRPLVIRDSSIVSVRAASGESALIASADGRDDVRIDAGDEVEVRKSARRLPVVALEGGNPFDVMRRKLGWGGREHARPPEARR